MRGGVAQLTVLNDGIVAIDTEFVRPLLDASHLIIEDGCGAIVDTGTNHSVPLIIDAVQQQGLDIGDIEFVFLTHVHLDHAGGAGTLMQALPNAKCVIHPRGARHMIDPTKLIAGTEAVYGVEQTQQMYGTILPVDAARVVVPSDEEWFDLNGRALQIVFTEGHARHHYCLNDPTSKGVFTGDSFGISYRELDTAAGEFIFPATTPASFDPVEAHKSIDRIMAFEPEHLFLTHYSRISDLERLATDMHARIDDYVQIALGSKDAVDRTRVIEEKLLQHLASGLKEHGFGGDEEAILSVICIDARINAQGLVAWLQRSER